MAHELILVIDDNETGLSLTRTILLGFGYLVKTAYDAEAALDILASPERLPDLIVLDLNLPRMSGLELAKQIRAVGCMIPIIAFTAYSTGAWDFPEQVYAAGCDGFVEKNGDVDTLPRVIGQFFRRREAKI